MTRPRTISDILGYTRTPPAAAPVEPRSVDLAARRTVTVEEAAAILGISRTAAYQAASSGQLPTIRIGRRIVVPTAPLARLLGLDGEAS